MFQKKPHHSDEWVDTLVDSAYEAIQAYEDYLLDKIDHNKLAKVMKRLYNILPPPERQKARRIEDRNHKDFFQ